MKREIFVPFPDSFYKNAYSISNYGNVKRIVATYNTKAGIILKPYKASNGYYTIKLWHKNKAKGFYIHRAVCLAFLVFH